jgi:Zn-dependent protease with chaperone function
MKAAVATNPLSIEHPAKAWSRLGISDTRFVFVALEIFLASCLLLLGESAVLIRLSNLIDGTDFSFWTRHLAPLFVVTLAGLAIMLWRWWARAANRDSQEVPFDGQRHSEFASRVDSLLQSAALRRSVELRYLPWRSDPNAHVSRNGGRFSLTFTRGLVVLHRSRPAEAEAVLNHEISHMQADDVRFTNLVRRGSSFASVLIFAVNGLILTIYLVRRVLLNDLGNGLAIAGAMLVSLTAPLAGLLYYREYLLGREFMHDLRAVQLMSSAEPMKAYLRTLVEESPKASLLASFHEFRKHFQAFHPTPAQRLRNLELLDPFRDWSVVAPFFAGAFLALLPIELGLFCAALDQRDLQRPLEWVTLVLSTVLLLRSDFSRLAIYAILREKAIVRILRFLILVLLGSLISVLPFLILSSAVRGRNFIVNFLYAWRGLVWTAIGYTGAALFLAYPTAVGLLLRQKKIASVVIQSLSQLLTFATILFFTLITLSRGDTAFQLAPALVLWAGISLSLALIEASFGKCQCCGKRAWNSLLLQNTCRSCGCDRIPRSIL